jgi:hypothetical protein
MGDDTQKLQKDPPEGSRKVVEREFERQPDDADGGAEKRQDPAASQSRGKESGQIPSR